MESAARNVPHSTDIRQRQMCQMRRSCEDGPEGKGEETTMRRRENSIEKWHEKRLVSVLIQFAQCSQIE